MLMIADGLRDTGVTARTMAVSRLTHLFQNLSHFLIGQHDRLSHAERLDIVASQDLDFNGESERLLNIAAYRYLAMIGEKTGITPFQRLQRVFRELLRAVSRVFRTSNGGPARQSNEVMIGLNIAAMARKRRRIGGMAMQNRMPVGTRAQYIKMKAPLG